MKTIIPITKSPPPTTSPNTLTMLPGSPVVSINLVLDTFKEIRKTVVNNSKVGNADIPRTSLVNIAFKRITKERAILKASSTSRIVLFIGTIKKTIATNKYKPTAISFFFILITLPFFITCYMMPICSISKTGRTRN